MALQSAVDGEILLLRVRIRMLKMCEYDCLHWLILICDELHSKLLRLSTLRACFIAIHVCSGETRFNDLTKFHFIYP